MTIKEQNSIKKEYYTEALRYMDNAKETLQKAGKDGGFYNDDKYVKTACGIAYNGVLKALDGLFVVKNVKIPKGRKSIEYYRDNVAKIDKKLMKCLNTAYNLLHLDGYYDGVTHVKTLQNGFELAYEIIENIKPLEA